MRLNYDCVRDVMLWAEELTAPNRYAVYVDVDAMNTSSIFLRESDKPQPNEFQKKLLEKYSNETLVYHIRYCLKAKFLEGNPYDNRGITITDLTPEGHQFLADIRSNTIFNKTKEIGIKLGVESLHGIARIAEGVVTETIKTYLASQL